MTASATVMTTEVELIEEALDRLLTAACRYRAEPTIDPAREGPVGAAVVGGGFIASLEWGEARRKADVYLRRPVGAALRHAIRILGKRLHELGGLGLMGEVCSRVTGVDPQWESIREGILDHTWDGVGEWMA